MKVYERYRVITEFEELSYTGEKHSVFNFKELEQANNKFNEQVNRGGVNTVYLCKWYQCCDGIELYNSEIIVKEWNLYPQEDNSHLFR